MGIYNYPNKNVLIRTNPAQLLLLYRKPRVGEAKTLKFLSLINKPK